MSAEVCFIGLGYIGLPTAVLLADSGLKVVGFDADSRKVSQINEGVWESTEPGLIATLNHTQRAGRFVASTEPVPAEAFIIAVPTPLTRSKVADLSYVLNAGSAIAPVLKPGDLVILESTVPPGTTEKLAREVYSHRPDLAEPATGAAGGAGSILFAHCPERILPGNAFEELRANDRVIGGLTREAADKAALLYRSFCAGHLHTTTAITAEMTKLAENSFRDVNIAFANELSIIAKQLGANPWEVIKLANHHPRVNILNPGPGVGGHCIAVDPLFLAEASPESSPLIRTARSVNDSKPSWVVGEVNDVLDPELSGAVMILGLAYKPNIDDLRESPSLKIAEKLASAWTDISFLIVEPHISELPEVLRFRNVELVNVPPSPNSLQLVLYLVDHDDFRDIDWSAYNTVNLIDARGPLSRTAGDEGLT